MNCISCACKVRQKSEFAGAAEPGNSKVMSLACHCFLASSEGLQLLPKGGEELPGVGASAPDCLDELVPRWTSRQDPCCCHPHAQ